MTQNGAERHRAIRTFRGSAAPLNMACPGSAHPEPDEILLDNLNSAATVGTVAHKLAEPIVLTGRVPNNWQEICRSYGLDKAQTQDVQSLMWAAKAFWDAQGAAFPHPKVEARFRREMSVPSGKDFWLTAHVDVLDIVDYTGMELDWKSTRLDINYVDQMLSYAWQLCLDKPELTQVTTGIVFLRDRTANIQTWSVPQIEDWAERFITRVVEWDGRSYTPGAHCGYCRRFATCPALREMNQGSIEQLGLIPLQNEYLPVSPVTVDMYLRVKALSTIIDRFKEMVNATVEQAGGELAGTNGQRLVLIPRSKDNINAALAWPIISPVLTRDELADCTTIKKTGMLALIAAHAPRGQKGKSKTAIMDKLNTAGAVTKTEFTALQVMQPKENSPKEIEIDAGNAETD